MRTATALFIGVCLLHVSDAQSDVKGLARYVEALGDESKDLSTDTPPVFAFTIDDAHVASKSFDSVRPTTQELGWWTRNVVAAEAIDKKAAWIAADVGENEIACGSAPCPPPAPKIASWHATILFDGAGKGWTYLAWHIADVVSAKQQAAALKAGKTPPKLERRIGPGAEDAVKLFETTIGDPKAFSDSVSTRKDVVLYGSELAERTVGGDKVKAKLAAWKLAFKVRDGVQAGVTASKTVAWIAANLDASSLKIKGAPTPYRVLALYEKTGAAWHLVQAQFSFAHAGG